MLIYRPDTFEAFFHSHRGPEIWAYLQSPDMILRMKTASYLGKPAVEPLSPALLRQFGGEITQDRYKQMIGHMVRQIMEHHGYQLDRSGVKIRRPGNMFYSASKYKERAAA